MRKLYHQLIDMSLNTFWEIVKDRGAWHPTVHGVSRSWTQLSNCTATTTIYNYVDEYSFSFYFILGIFSSKFLNFAYKGLPQQRIF